MRSAISRGMIGYAQGNAQQQGLWCWVSLSLNPTTIALIRLESQKNLFRDERKALYSNIRTIAILLSNRQVAVLTINCQLSTVNCYICVHLCSSAVHYSLLLQIRQFNPRVNSFQQQIRQQIAYN